MIKTEEFKMYGQLNDRAENQDIEAFVFKNGEVVPADQAENEIGPVVRSAPEKNYGQIENIANGNYDVEEFVFKDGNVVPANTVGIGPVLNTPAEKNYCRKGVLS